MALYDDPPHAVSTYSVTSAREGGGGTALTYALAQSAVPCSLNTVSASERELLAQLGIEVSHVVAVLSSQLTTPIVRGMKLTDEAGNAYHVEGIRAGRPYGSIPAFTYIQCREIL